ncbi:OsmC family protein [Candidatus Zixiibacteriota bacterium]|nr:OsmC family protein [candidate division Zixibacteria bacterium]
MEEKLLKVTMERIKDFEFNIKFEPHMAELLMDEPSPLGADKGPNASRVLSAAIGNCLTASLLFCLQKARIEVGNVKTEVTTALHRTDKGRLRIGNSEVAIRMDIGTEAPNRMGQCIRLFEDFCVVTQSVRKGIPVAVKVQNQDGVELYNSEAAES